MGIPIGKLKDTNLISPESNLSNARPKLNEYLRGRHR